MYVWVVCAHVSTAICRVQESFKVSRSGVTGGCEFPSVDVGNGTLVHDKKTIQTASALCGKNCGGRQWLELDMINVFIKTILCKLENDKIVNVLNLIGVYFIRIRCEEKTALSF